MIYPANTNLCRSTFFLIFLFSFLTVNAQIPINDSPCISDPNPPLDLTGIETHNGTTCGATFDFENVFCSSETENASVWYIYSPNENTKSYNVNLETLTLDAVISYELYWAYEQNGCFLNFDEVITASCSNQSPSFTIANCHSPSQVLFIKVTSSTNLCGNFEISITPSNCQEGVAENNCVDITMNVGPTITPNNCEEDPVYIEFTGSVECACSEIISGTYNPICANVNTPSVWIQVTVDDFANQMITNIEPNGEWEAVWQVFYGDCDNLTPITTPYGLCSSDSPDGNNIINVESGNDGLPINNSYYIGMRAIGYMPGMNPTFTGTVGSTNGCTSCFGFNVAADGSHIAGCNQTANFEVTERSSEKALDDLNFCPGEIVTICLDFFYDSSQTYNGWFHGLIPNFGNGWDLDYFDPASVAVQTSSEWYESGSACAPYLNEEMPYLCTYIDEEGTLQICNTLCDNTCPCESPASFNSPLPSGWFWVSPGGQAACSQDCSPSSKYGIGEQTAQINFCMDLKVKEFESFENCLIKSNLQIFFQPTSDGVSGCWEDLVSECKLDAAMYSPEYIIDCETSPNVSGLDTIICHNEPLNILISTIDGSTVEVYTIPIENNNITGANEYNFINGFGNIVDTLFNNTNQLQIQRYSLSAFDPTKPCNAPTDTLEVTVYPQIICENSSIPDTIMVCNFDNGIDSTCINFDDLAMGLIGTWNQDEIIPNFIFSNFSLDSVCFDNVPVGCYPFTFSTSSTEAPPSTTVMVCVNPCPCPSPATLSIPDLCNIDMFNLEDAQLTLDMGSWSVIDGPVGQDFTDIIIDDIFIAEDIFPGVYVVRFTLDSPGGPLCDAFSEQTINVIGLEQINVIGNGQMCNIENQQFPTSLDLYSLISVDANHGGSWTQTGTETILPITDGSTISSSGVMDYSQTFTFVYTSPGTGGPCPSTQIEVLVNIFDCSCPMLLVSSASLCNEGSLLDLNSLLTNDDNLPGTWSTDGNLVGPNIFDATGLISGVYTITYTLDSSPNPDCPLEYSNTIIVSDQPTAELNQGPQPCSLDTGNGPTAINLYNWLQSDYTLGSWSQTSGNIMVLSDDGINTAIVDFTGQNIGDQFTFLFTTTGAQDPCTDVSVEVNITVVDCNCPPVELSDPTPIFNDHGVSDLCSLIGVSDPGTFTAFDQAGDDASVNINSAGCIFDATGIEAGTYSIVYTLDLPVSGNCAQADTAFLEVLQFVSTNFVNNENIQINPNPTFNKLYIKSDYTISSLDLFTTAGKSIYQTHYPNVNNVEIDMSAYSSGLYLLQIKTENGRWVEKIIRI